MAQQASVAAARSSSLIWRSPCVLQRASSPVQATGTATVSRGKSFLAIGSYCGLACFTAPWFAAIGVASGLLGVVPAPGAGCVVCSGLLGVVPPLLGVVLVLFGVVPPLLGVVAALLAARAAACASGDRYT